MIIISVCWNLSFRGSTLNKCVFTSQSHTTTDPSQLQNESIIIQQSEYLTPACGFYFRHQIIRFMTLEFWLSAPSLRWNTILKAWKVPADSWHDAHHSGSGCVCDGGIVWLLFACCHKVKGLKEHTCARYFLWIGFNCVIVLIASWVLWGDVLPRSGLCTPDS